MELTTIVPFLKVGCGFCLMLFGIRYKLGLALSILLGSVAIGLLFGLSLLDWLQVSLLALVQEKFLLLVTIVGLILILSDGMEKAGQSKRLMASLSGYLTKPRLRLIFFPALIGLLPMPGGAVFSAPMVKAVSEDMSISDENRVVINYWFRHVWEMGWPLYPGIILTVALADIPVTTFISRAWPGVVAMFVIGYFFFLRSSVLVDLEVESDTNEDQKDFRLVLKEGLPLLVAIVGAVVCETFLAKFAPYIPFELGVIGALLTAIVVIVKQNSLGKEFFEAVLKKKSLWSMLLVIAAIFAFKDTMQAANIVEAMAAEGSGSLALFMAAVFLPFLVGVVAGINVAFVGATFPLLIGLLQSLGMQEQMVPYLILGSFAGFTGVMVSPIHICFILTCDFFKIDLLRAWRRLIAPSICLGGFGVVLFICLLRM